MRIAIIAAALLAGCAASQEYVWVKPGGSEQEFRMDSGQCRAQAFSVPGVALAQAVMVFESCLQGKGWQPTPKT